MSTENLQNFYLELRTNLDLLTELQTLASEEEFEEKVVALGASRGYEFTTAELKSALEDPAQFLKQTCGDTELSDLELRSISGGVYGFGILVGHNFINPAGGYGGSNLPTYGPLDPNTGQTLRK